METLEPADDRTKSDEQLFAESLLSRTVRRTSSFPLLSVVTGDGNEDDTVSLCNKNLLSVKGQDGCSVTAANSMGALPSRSNDGVRCGHRPLFLESTHHLPRVGSLMSVVHCQQALDHEAGDAPIDASQQARPQRGWRQTLQQTSLQFGLDFSFSIEGALVIPILLQLGLPENLYGLAWFLAPLLGFLMAPFIGSGSDQCHSPMGQRRPFILFLGVLLIVGTGLYLNSADLGALINENEAAVWGIVITMIGMVLADFGADGCDSPFKAYLMDHSNTQDIRRAFSMRSFLGGIGGGIGFICVGIDWEETFIGKALGSQLRVIFLINVFVVIVTLVLTLTSVREVPLNRSPPSEAGSKYTACGSEDVRKRIIKQDGTVPKYKETRRRSRSILSFFKKFSLCKSREQVEAQTVVSDSGENSERLGSSGTKDGAGDDFRQTKSGSGPYPKADCNHKNSGKANVSSVKPKDEISSSARRQFVPQNRAKASNKARKKASADLSGGSCCVVKVSLNDDPKDVLKSTMKVNGGHCPVLEAAPRGDTCVGSVVSICSPNPSVEVNCGSDEDGGESDDDDDNKSEQSISRLQLLCSAVYMPRELRFLCFANFFTWAGLIVALCFFTDFVAQAVYHGDPSAPEDSEEFQLYEQGVQMGSWGLCIYSFSSSVVSLAMPYLQNHLSQKCLYVGSQLIFAGGCAATAFLTNRVYVVLILCVTHGLLLVIVMTIPHNILAAYHKSEKYKNPAKGLPRRLGTDLACLDCQLFLSQVIVSAAIGPLIQATGSHLTIMGSATLFSLVAALSAGFLISYEVDDP